MSKEKINLIAVIPAQSGFYVVEKMHHEAGDDIPKAADIFLLPVVAWSIERFSFGENFYTFPITVHGRNEDHIAIVNPNGTVDNMDGTWSDLQDFLDYQYSS